MIKGTTSTGFTFSIEDEVIGDYEVLEELSNLDKGEMGRLTTVVDMLLGREQRDALKEHVRALGENGRVSTERMLAELKDILSQNQETKN